MSPPGDPPERQPAAADAPDHESDTETLDPSDVATLEALEEAKDVETLLNLAAAYETGTDDIEVDPARAVLAYEAASRLGAADASYWLARAAFDEGVSPATLERGARFLRLAADAAHVEARVFLGNLYELGVHYELNLDKADLWYRSAARAAGIEEEPGSPEWSVEMAQLGCVRSIVPLLEDTSVPKKHRLVYLRLVKNVGYALFLEQKREKDAAAAAEALAIAEAEREVEEALVRDESRDQKTKKAEAAVDRAEKRADGELPAKPGLSFVKIAASLALGAGAGYGGFFLHQAMGQHWLPDPLHQAAAVGAGVFLFFLFGLGIRKKE